MMHDQVTLKEGQGGPDVVDADDRKYVRIGYLAIGAGFGSFMIWAALAPLDQGVPGVGVVTVIDQRKVVQHPTGGLIEELLIKEGDRVREGQVIARLNAADSNAQAETLRAQYRAAKSGEQRLIAEIKGKRSLASGQADSLMSEAMSNQADLLRSNQAILAGELAAMRDALDALQQQAITYRNLYENRRQQSDLARQQLAGVKELSAAGYYPRNRALEAERAVSEQEAKAGETAAQLAQIESSIAEMRHKISLRQFQFRRDSESELVTRRQEVLSLKARLDAAEFSERSLDIAAPANGVAVGLRFHGKGEVVPAGGRIVDIVPDNEQLIIEARFSPEMADELSSNLKAEIRFSGINRADLPIIDGEVMTVSADRLIDEANRTPYFLARVQISRQGMELLGRNGIAIQPGMPAEVLVKTGERTLLEYLLAPIKDRMEWAFIEK